MPAVRVHTPTGKQHGMSSAAQLFICAASGKALVQMVRMMWVMPTHTQMHIHTQLHASTNAHTHVHARTHTHNTHSHILARCAEEGRPLTLAELARLGSAAGGPDPLSLHAHDSNGLHPLPPSEAGPERAAALRSRLSGCGGSAWEEWEAAMAGWGAGQGSGCGDELPDTPTSRVSHYNATSSPFAQVR